MLLTLEQLKELDLDIADEIIWGCYYRYLRGFKPTYFYSSSLSFTSEQFSRLISSNITIGLKTNNEKILKASSLVDYKVENKQLDEFQIKLEYLMAQIVLSAIKGETFFIYCCNDVEFVSSIFKELGYSFDGVKLRWK